MPRIVCPYCYEAFDSMDAECMCSNNKLKANGEYECAHQTTEAYDRIWGGQNYHGYIFKPQTEGFLWNKKFKAIQKCPQCGRNEGDRFVCPNCHNRLPKSMIEEGAEVISVIGAPYSGKTNYIVTLIHELNKFGYRLNLSVYPSQICRDGQGFEVESTLNRYRDLSESLFPKDLRQKPMVLLKTVEKGEDEPQIPLFFKLEQSTNKKTIWLVFYDTAGETFMEKAKRLCTQYMRNSSGIILILDPFSIPEIARRVKSVNQNDNVISSNIKNASQNDLETIQAVINDITEEMSQVLKKPISFVFSKFDIILNNRDAFNDASFDGFLDENGRFKDSSFKQTGEVDITNINNNSDRIEGLLREIFNEGSLVETAKKWNTKKENLYKFFGVSAFGRSESKFEAGSTVKPYWVMDPLIWILHKLGQFDFKTR